MEPSRVYLNTELLLTLSNKTILACLPIHCLLLNQTHNRTENTVNEAGNAYNIDLTIVRVRVFIAYAYFLKTVL